MLWEHNPKLVIAHLSGFGQYGTEEYTNLPAYNTIARAFSGYLIQNGDVDQPMPAFPYTADYFSGMTATTAALAALHRVRETGKGESIDVAMYEVMLRMGQYFMMDYFNGGEICPRMTKGKDPYYAGCGLYKCADGYIVMELVGITQINECFKDIGLAHILGTPEVPEGTQLIHRVECPYAVSRGKTGCVAGDPFHRRRAGAFRRAEYRLRESADHSRTGKQPAVRRPRIHYRVAHDGWPHL